MAKIRRRAAPVVILVEFVAIACLGAGVGAAGNEAPLFPNAAHPTGPRPLGMALGDFNGDGLPDVATANNGKEDPWLVHRPSVSVLLGQADGGFSPEVRFTDGWLYGQSPVAAVAGDFDGDGHLDLALANAPPDSDPPYFTYNPRGTLSVLLGRGDGTLGPQTHFQAGDYPVSIAAGDFNGDGRLDAVVVNSRSNDLSVLIGRGDGTFEIQARYPTALHPRNIVVEDLNLDGRPDFAVVCTGIGEVSVLLGRGDGTFGPQSAFRAGISSSAVGTGDLNADGRPDLVVGNEGSDDLAIFLGRGDGTFVLQSRVAAGTSPASIVVADLDQDGRLDVVEGNAYPAEAHVFLGAGDGTLVPSDVVHGGTNVPVLALSDPNRDGQLDLVMSRLGADDVVVALGRGNGTFAPQPRILLTGTDPEAVVATDLDGDGRPDLAAANRQSNDVSVFLARGQGVFDSGARYAAGTSPIALAAGDLTGDGIADLAVANLESDDVSILPGRGDGTFAAQIRLVAGDGPMSVAVVDFDLDGFLDLAVANSKSNDVSLFPGHGNGTLGPQIRVPIGEPATSLATGDFDADGRPDLAVGGFFSGQVFLLSGSQAGSLEIRTTTNVGGPVGHLGAGDLNGDGRPDLVATIYPASSVSRFAVLLGRGDAGFDLADVLDANGAANSFDLADFDGDGILDLSGIAGEGEIQIWTGAGDGGFRPLGRFAAGNVAWAVAAADLDGDGRPDLAVANTIGDLWVLLNQKRDPNAPPVASAGPDVRTECVSPEGALVVLDGSASSDPDSTPGTHDDIATFEWLEDRGLPSQVRLGGGERLTVTLSLGAHRIALVVTDHAGASSADEVVVQVADTTPPTVSLILRPESLWPPNHRMVNVEALLNASDACGPAMVILMSVTSNEPDDAPGAGDGNTLGDIQDASPGTADFVFSLRAERASAGAGRIYTVAYAAADASGNTTPATASVSVPHDRGGVVEPLIIAAEETPAGTLLRWSEAGGALVYTAVRGNVGSLRETETAIDLGETACLAVSQASNTLGHEDSAIPPAGQAIFYLVQYRDGSVSSSYGTEGVGKPRAATSGGCP